MSRFVASLFPNGAPGLIATYDPRVMCPPVDGPAPTDTHPQ